MDLSTEIIALLVAVAVAAGFVDAIAGGGGLLALPALLACGVPPVSALGVNKVQSLFGTSMACFTYARGGHIDFRSMAAPAAAAFAGSTAGAVVLQGVDPSFLGGFVPVMLIAIAGYFLLSPQVGEIDRHRRLQPLAYSAVAFAIGFYDGFFGPGAGAFYAVSLISLVGLGLTRATAHTKVLNMTSNLAAVIVLAMGGHIMWMLGLAMAAGNLTGARLGAMTAMRFGGRLIRPLLVVVSLALTVKLLADPDNPIAKMTWAR